MRLLLTGLNGTLAPKVAAAAVRRGWQVNGWDRYRVPPADAGACRAFLLETKPDAILHLAMGEESWAGLLATYASEAGVPFVFTSTAMVFDCVPDGPHAVEDTRTAKDDYGRYKIRCEDAVWAAPGPVAGRTVARIGWQIDADDSGRATGNNMLAYLDACGHRDVPADIPVPYESERHARREVEPQQERDGRDGRITASTLWRPACSFMTDTADALLGFVAEPAGGTVHVDSNAIEAHTFDRIVAALKIRYARDQWRIVPDESYRHDQRLVGGEGRVVGLSKRLASLR